ncbi:MAG: hypothetical protein ACYDHX_04480 [Methanothrix sp.]
MLLTATGLSWAGTFDFNPGQTAVLHTNNMQDDVQGHGYVMEYKKINTNNLSLLEYSHGSGFMDFADTVSSQQKTTTSSMYYYWVFDYTTEQWKKYPLGGNSNISITKQYDNVQAPTTFAYGTGWYASHPVTYNSLLKDKTEARSYQEGISMERQVEYARGLKGDITVDINCTGPTDKANGKGLLSMKIEDNVTEGTMHIGEQLLSTLKDSTGNPRSMKVQGVKEPIIETDVNYVGDFHVQKNMKIEMKKFTGMWATDWLPCCSGGFFDVPNYDTEHVSQKGIFDCTCRNTSISTMQPKWNTTMAQFPTAKFQYKT